MSDNVENVEEINEDDAAAITKAAEKVTAEESLETTVREKMAEIFDGGDDEDEVEDDVTEDDDKKKDKEADDTDDTEDDDKDKDKGKDKDKNEVTDGTTSEDGKKIEDETLTLSAKHIQTAIRLGMSEDEVKENFDKNPEVMISLLGALHKGENELNARYAQQGRAVAQKHVTDQKTTTSEEDTSLESFVDLKKIRSRFDDDDEEADALIDGVIKPLNDALVKMQKQMDQRVQPTDQSAYSQQEERAIQSEVNSFFDNDRLKEYQEYYGTVKPGEDPRTVLTGAQFKHRGEVCREGNFIKLGAAESGEQLTVSDVLQRAHSQLTEPMREVMIREKIISKIKKRDRSLSLKVGTKTVPKALSSKDTEKQLEIKTKSRLARIFGI